MLPEWKNLKYKRYLKEENMVDIFEVIQCVPLKKIQPLSTAFKVILKVWV